MNRFQAYFNRKYTGREDGLRDAEPEGRKIDEIFLTGLSPEKQRETNFVWPLLNGEGTTFFDFNGGDAGEFPLPEGGGGGGSSTPRNPPTTDPCAKAKTQITNANITLNNAQVKQNMNNVLLNKTQSVNEFAIKLGQNSDGSYAFSNMIEGGKDKADLNMAILPTGSSYIADGHTHSGGYGDPSGGDLYGMLQQITNNTNFKYRFTFGYNGESNEVYALVLNDRNEALNFLTNYPKEQNYDPDKHSFLPTSLIGIAYFEASDYASMGSYIDNSGEYYNQGAMAMAYVLDSFNTGISLAKVDAYGNLKKVNVQKGEITVPYSGGVTKTGLTINKCP